MVARMIGRRNCLALLLRMQIGDHYLNRYGSFSKIKNRAALRASNSTSGYLFGGNENTNWKRHAHHYAHCNMIYNIQDVEATYVAIDDEWMKKTWYIYNGMLLCRNKGNPVFLTTWMDHEGSILRQVNQIEKYKHHMLSFVCGNYFKNQTHG